MVLKSTRDVKIYNGKRYLLQGVHSTKNDAKKFANKLQNRRGTQFYTRVVKIPKKWRDARNNRWAVFARRKTKGK